jgi:hypothetical protein
MYLSENPSSSKGVGQMLRNLGFEPELPGAWWEGLVFGYKL